MKKMIIAILLTFVALFSFSACGNKYNAKIVENGVSIHTEWLENNRTYGAFYENPDCEVENERYVQDKTSPKTRTYVVKGQSGLDEIFSDFLPIDFEKEMVLVYCYTDIYNRNRILGSVCVDENNILQVQFKNKETIRAVGDATMPQGKVLVIKMDKLEITDVVITKI